MSVKSRTGRAKKGISLTIGSGKDLAETEVTGEVHPIVLSFNSSSGKS